MRSTYQVDVQFGVIILNFSLYLLKFPMLKDFSRSNRNSHGFEDDRNKSFLIIYHFSIILI